MKHNQLQSIPWLILVTKVDKPDALPVSEIVQILDLGSRDLKVGCVLSCSSATGKGVDEAVDWMVVAAKSVGYKKGETVSAF